MADQHFTLNTGARIPALGLGTWQGKPGETQKAVAHALSIGYTHIDCGLSASFRVPSRLTSKLTDFSLRVRK
jgi:hypothetical protein